MSNIEQRLARVEAELALSAGFNEYLYGVDGGWMDTLADVYTEDGIFTVWDLPLGTKQIFRVEGRAALLDYYSSIPTGIFRHHAINVMIAIDDDVARAQMSAFLLVISGQAGDRVGYVGGASGFSVVGGIYESTWRREPDRWRMSHLHVANQYHWEGPSGLSPKFYNDLGHGTWHGGRPLTRYISDIPSGGPNQDVR